MSLLTSILQSKKGFPRPNKDSLKKAEAETVVKLTTKTGPQSAISIISWADERSIHPKVETVLSKSTFDTQLRRSVHELLSGVRYTDADRFAPFFPSTSANYLRSRNEAGAVGAILSRPDLLKGLRRMGGYLHVDKVKEEKEERRENAPSEEIRVTSGIDAFTLAFRLLYSRILEAARHELPVVEPLGLAEPLKVRVITKGPPLLYFIMRQVWKKVHSALRRHRCFRLIGEPINSEYIWEMLGSRLKDDEVFVSGDYKDSTNNLHSWVSNVIGDEISKVIGLSSLEQTFFIDSLTGHLFLPEESDCKTDKQREDLSFTRKNPGERIPDSILDLMKFQKEGQLMGSITSFVVLCIANFTICRWAMEVDKGKPMTAKTLPLMINGDDCGFKTGSKGYQYWQKIAKFSGMEESVGKTYVSREFINMNSMNFIYYPTEPEPVMTTRLVAAALTQLPITEVIFRFNPFHQVSYINMGLVRGLKRSTVNGLNAQERDLMTIGTHYREAQRLAPPHMRWMVDLEFVKQNFRTLKASRLPWRIPEWLGGLGLTGPGSPSPSRLDRQIAARIVREWSRRRPIAMGRQSTPWQIWRLAQKSVPAGFSTFQGDLPGIEQYNHLISQKCVDLLFDSRYDLDDLLKEVDSETEKKRFLRHNERLWRPQGWLPPPLEESRLLFLPIRESAVPDPSFVASSSRPVVSTTVLD